MSLHLSEYFNTEVHVGSINAGLLNQLVINDMYIKDLSGKKCVTINKANATIELLPLILRKDIIISSLQLSGLKADIYREDQNAPLNIDFIIKKLESKEDGAKKKKFLIESLVVNNSNLAYNVLSENKKNGFDINHLLLNEFEMVANIHSISPDNIDLDLQELSFKEAHSALSLNHLSSSITAKNNSILIKKPYININSSFVSSDSIFIENVDSNKENLLVKGNIYESKLTPSDFSFLLTQLQQMDSPIHTSTDFIFTKNNLTLNNLIVTTEDKKIYLDGDIGLTGLQTNNLSTDANFNSLSIDTKELPKFLHSMGMHLPKDFPLSALGTVNMRGDISMTPNYYVAKSDIKTDLGDIIIDCTFDNDKKLKGHIETDGIQVNRLVPDFDLKNIAMNLDLDMTLSDHIPEGKVSGRIQHIEYSDYKFSNINLDGELTANGYNGLIDMKDPNLDLKFDGLVQGIEDKDYKLNAVMSVNGLQPSILGLTGEYAQNKYSFQTEADIHGRELEDISGSVQLTDLRITGSKQSYSFDRIFCDVINHGNQKKEIRLESDIISGMISGEYSYHTLYDSFLSIPESVLSLFGGNKEKRRSTQDVFEFSLTANNHPFLHNVIHEPFDFESPIHMEGIVDVPNHHYIVKSNIPSFNYDNKQFNDIDLDFEGNHNNYSIFAKGKHQDGEKAYESEINATGSSNSFNSSIGFNIIQDNPISGTLNIDGKLDSRKDSGYVASISLKPSEVNFMNREFNIEADYIDIFKNHLNIEDFRLENEDKYLTINGVLSKDSSDCLVADLNGTKIQSLFEIAGAELSNIDGFVYGQCQVYDILSSPKVNGNLTVQDLVIKDNNIGNAYILANWDKEHNAIELNTQVVGEETSNGNRRISANGYINAVANEADINIDCTDVDASLLNGLIGRTFKDIAGNINGKIGIRGPFEDLQVLGELKTDASITLRATNVTYYISPDDVIKVGKDYIAFNKIHVSDYDGHTNIIDGYVTHKGFKDFTYKFDMNFTNMLAYEETTYNSDKFMGKVYGDGELHINGADGHPVYINIDVTPAKDSEFYYDVSTPDAITGNSFISFRELAPTDSILIANNVDPGWYWSVRDSVLNSNTDAQQRKYKGDLFVNIGIHMNHNCPIKLRMDSADDAYITIYGTGTLRAEYYNKGAFSLNGTYNIQDGKYRLYLQDIIYRDLIIQDGSNVVFNGNPFEADIHLICWYTLNSVPLSDLTSVTYTQNNRVKVNCILDITGNLGNMQFNFDLNLPNVSDETRQIVRSYISTEEEMNKQMIYLLGFGRFFTNEYARANGDSNTNQAVNNLLSSTLSGQINQILSNAVGTDSKWNFGTGLSTGEKGWEDMDVEGTLSGKLLDDRLLINGNFGYRDNSMTNNSSFVGDFDVKWRITEKGNTYLKAYNLTNDRYFTKSTLNTQGVGISYQKDFESWKDLFRFKKRKKTNGKDVADSSEDSILSVETSTQINDNILILRNDTTK